MKKILITTFCLSILIFACKKTNDVTTYKMPQLNDEQGVPVTNSEIDPNLKWIAKGYARLFYTNSNKSLWNNYLSNKPNFEETHLYSNPYFYNQNSIDFDSDVKSAVDNDFPSNDYIQSFYYGFEYDNCDYNTGLRLVDPQLSNLNYRVTYTPFDPNSSYDSIYGYFINPSTNSLDSTLLTDDNYDDYDVYIVYAYSTCEDNYSCPLPGCNENGVCEPMKGENKDNCDDCKGHIQPGDKTLEVLGVTLKEDKHMFDESWIEGKYELGWNWLISTISNGNNIGLITTNRTLESEENVILYNRWKRNEIVRCKKDGSKCKGNSTTKGPLCTNVMYEKFDPSTQSILIHFYEKQPGRRGMGYNFTPEINGNSIDFSSTNDFSNSFDVQCKENFGSFHKVQSSTNNGEGVIYIQANSTWVLESIGGVNYMTIIKSTPAHNGEEIDVKLGYKL